MIYLDSRLPFNFAVLFSLPFKSISHLLSSIKFVVFFLLLFFFSDNLEMIAILLWFNWFPLIF